MAEKSGVIGGGRLLGGMARAGWRAADWRAFLAQEWAAELAHGRLFLWIAPAMGGGALAHFSCPADPPALLLYPAVLICFLLALGARGRFHLYFLSYLLAGFGAGLASADLAVRLAAAPRIESVVGKAEVSGLVTRVEGRAAKSPRVLIEVAEIAGKERPPRRLIAVGSNLSGLKVGDAVKFTARLAPLPLPTHPGAYSPGFAGFFNGVGGYAFVSGKPDAINLPRPSPAMRLWLAIEAWRTGMTDAIVARLGPEIGPLAAALVTGQRTAITDDINQQFNAAGLLHVLSISGLHMALVAGGAFWLVRALLAAIPALALRLPLKKVAAVLALAMAAFYEVASGAEVATTRSFIMIAIVFTAILLDRPAITMRNLALSALILLAIEPYAIVSPSFQMSYVATATLVAVYERRWLPALASEEQSKALRMAARIMEAVLATAIVSILVEIAMLPVTLHHFHRIAWFGVVGNVLAMVVVDMLVMPLAVLALVTLSFGRVDAVIDALGFAVERMLDVARFVAAFPHALSLVHGFSAAAMMTATFGVMLACLWKSRFALFGLPFYVAGAGLWAMATQPDVYISANGRLVAARDSAGVLRADGAKSDSFALSRWLETDGDSRKTDAASLGDGRLCDRAGCTLKLGRDKMVAIAQTADALQEDCSRADLLLIPNGRAPPTCPFPRLILDQKELREAAGIALYWRDGAPSLVSNAQTCGSRPWCPSPDLRSREIWPRAQKP